MSTLAKSDHRVRRAGGDSSPPVKTFVEAKTEQNCSLGTGDQGEARRDLTRERVLMPCNP